MQPTSRSISGEISAVNAPSRSQYMFCAPMAIGEPFNASPTAGRAVKGGMTTTSCGVASLSSPSRRARANATASETVLCIFQLPAKT